MALILVEMALNFAEMALAGREMALSPTFRFRNTIARVVGKTCGFAVLVASGFWYASGSPEWIVPDPVSGYGVTLFLGLSLLIEFSCHFCHFCHNCPDPKLSEGRSSYGVRSCHICPASATLLPFLPHLPPFISVDLRQARGGRSGSCPPPYRGTGPAPVSGYGAGSRIGVRGRRCFGRGKIFLILPAPSAPSAPAKAKGETIQLWDRVHFREIVSAPYLHLLLPLPRVART